MVGPTGPINYRSTGDVEGVSMPPFEVSQVEKDNSGDREFFNQIESSLEMCNVILSSLSSDLDIAQVDEEKGEDNVKNRLGVLNDQIRDIDMQQQSLKDKIDELKKNIYKEGKKLQKDLKERGVSIAFGDHKGEPLDTIENFGEIKIGDLFQDMLPLTGEERSLFNDLEGKRDCLKFFEKMVVKKLEAHQEERGQLFERFDELKVQSSEILDQMKVYEKVLKKQDRTDLSKLKVTKEHCKQVMNFESQIGTNPPEIVNELIRWINMWVEPLKYKMESVNFIVTPEELEELKKVGLSFTS